MPRKPLPTIVCGGALAAALLALLGCGAEGPTLAPVAGVVRMNGQPVEKLSVTFFPSHGRAGNGITDGNGRFVLSTYKHGDGALIGEHRVTLLPMLDPPLYMPDGRLRPASPRKGPSIPQRYADAATTDLAATVAGDGPNEFVFDVNP